jgi:hypothetical protein
VEVRDASEKEVVVKANDRRRVFQDPPPHVEPRSEQIPLNRRFGHLPGRIHLHRGYRLRGRLVRFAKHRRKSTAG